MEEILLRMNEDGVFEEYKEPFAIIECPTEEDFLDLQEAVRYKEANRWIPVTERLPDKELWEHQKLYDDDLEVLVMIKGAKKATTLYYNEEGEFYAPDGNGATFYKVTHWMPLPEPPKEG